MDLSFTLNPRETRRARKWVASLADIRASAAERRISAKRRVEASLPGGQENEADWVHILACTITPRGDGWVDAVALSGSFNPRVARQLMVGKTE